MEVLRERGREIFVRFEEFSCENFPALVILGNEMEFGVFWAEAPGKGTSASCSGGGGTRNGHAVLPHGKSKFSNPPGGIPFAPEYMLIGNVSFAMDSGTLVA